MWYDCSEGAEARSNTCSIYFDPGGRLLITARYRLRGAQRAAAKDEFRGMVLGGEPWGYLISLEGGKELYATDVLFYEKGVK
jgi:hypothetical protein